MDETEKENYYRLKANRFEVIDHTETNTGLPRALTKWDDKPFKIVLSWQDDDRTLKVFLMDLTEEKPIV